jgi:hypothetical protein
LDVQGNLADSITKTTFGDNWSAPAEYEYCFAHFDSSSPAYVAALSRFHYYVTGKDLAAGYYWRDRVLRQGLERQRADAVEIERQL